MAKIGVVTLHNSINYGGVLQAVALNECLKKQAHEVVFLNYQKEWPVFNSPIKYRKLRIHYYGNQGVLTKFRILGGMAKTALSNIYYIERKRKHDGFQKFVNKYLAVTPQYNSMEELKENYPDCDFYITGSDQVWNNYYTMNRFDEAYFLGFVDDGNKKIAYGASIGGARDDAYVKEIISLIKDFKAISVREKSLEEQMIRLGASLAGTVLDPTLLLTAKDWMQFEKTVDINEPFILMYGLEQSDGLDQIVQNLHQKYNICIVDIFPGLTKIKGIKYCDKVCSPGEFLWYARNASYIVTNSFHGTVFSIIFEKDFLTIARSYQESRMVDLLSSLGLSKRLWEQNKSSFFDELDVIDYGVVKKRLKCYQKESLQFLLGALND
ncbi:polysaccharide pyruvyl transferase family protein [uncultured Robinsoniella sp.]|uniref:polysaccharide pyruvyl transferase family protein n=1 Tax=uncultured Robinsoniella sp. TaxID=904190 RepID=UPI00374F1F7E